jgi:hypothetical protein
MSDRSLNGFISAGYSVTVPVMEYPPVNDFPDGTLCSERTAACDPSELMRTTLITCPEDADICTDVDVMFATKSDAAILFLL